MPTQRYKLTVAYRGTHYHGWQAQSLTPKYKGEVLEGDRLPTIQEHLARAVKSVVRHPLQISGSSRTDSGVHAKGQIAHFDTDKTQIPIEGMRRAINHALPADILVRKIEPVPDSFDSIRSTISKRYQYVIWNAPDRPLFFPDLAWHRWQPLDRPAMQQAAQLFEGTHDFASFARPGHGRENTIRTIHSCTVSWRGPKLVIGVEGSGFLWNMVRIMVGTLVEVGVGRYPPEKIADMLRAKTRQSAGPTAPPEGLYLQWINAPVNGAASGDSATDEE